jgi:hypothetical protein
MKNLQISMCGQLVRSFYYVKWGPAFESSWNQAFWTILPNMRYGRVYVASNSRQIGNKNFCIHRSVKLVSNSHQIGSKNFCSSRFVKLASNSRQIGNKPFSSNRSVKLASKVYMPFQLNFFSRIHAYSCKYTHIMLVHVII